uniref:Rho guanine nucleotide exchange factor 12 n=3 Tax=Photinus pyralis TaxID=7054 RepID=A0A1Y1KTQ6_PHOPY
MLVDKMNNIPTHLTDRNSSSLNGTGARRPSPIPIPLQTGAMVGVTGRPVSLMDSTTAVQAHIVQVIINKDENGYGMKVSGDNPVYVQSVREGGAAEKAGLHAGDKIIKVNGVNVMNSTHTEVVTLIKSSGHVTLTVQQRSGVLRTMGSPSLHTRPLTTHSSQRITGPQPVTYEKQYQLQLEREQQIRLMIEKEQRFIDQLRSEIAVSPNDKKSEKLVKAESNLQKLHTILQNHVRTQNEQRLDNLDTPPPLPKSPPPNVSHTLPPKLSKKHSQRLAQVPSSHGFILDNEVPPPLPKRNRSLDAQNNAKPLYINGKVPLDINAMFLFREVPSENNNAEPSPNSELMITNSLYSDTSSLPPPLPPRLSNTGCSDPDAVNSINKQMSYPLVATCTTLVNNYSPNHTHHRTKSSPDSLCAISPAEASRRLIASESMNDLSRTEIWESAPTPPGTPPPPYPSPVPGRKQYSNRNSADDCDLTFEENIMETSLGLMGRVLANSSPIHAATSQTAQQPIISMEDDEISDPEVGQLEDHGPFKSLSRLWEHTPHLAVFMNYVLSNSDPSSLLFYLITDLYKEGNAKEMRKWAFEIHSSFLVPGAHLRLSNVDENIAREIDDVLTHEFDKEEILRRIFWKARTRAKEELTRQLADFQQKRTAGLGTIFGPNDAMMAEISQDKAKEVKLYESLLLDKLDPYLDELDRDNYDPRRYLTAAALATVITRVFGVRPAGHALDRFPTFVNKEKSFRTKFIGRYSRKLILLGHQFVAQPYFTVIPCNHCHQIISGIAPQGYQCAACLINLHRLCVKLYDDTCPGPINKKDRGIGKLMDRIHSRDHRRKPSANFIQMEKERRLAEERDAGLDLDILGETKPGHPVSRTGSDRRPDAVREEASRTQESQENVDQHETDLAHPDSTVSLPAYTGNKKRAATNINRSESVKEQSEKRKQRRNISDPLHNTTNETVDLDQHGLSYQTHSGSSSNSSLSSSRSSESPSTSLDAVSSFPTAHPAGTGWDSDMEIDADPSDWQSSVPEDELANLSPHERKRQDVINELFHTERSHVRNLWVLENLFKKPLQLSKLLKNEEINLIFPNLGDLLEIHSQLNTTMKNKRKENPVIKDIGDMLLNMFDGVVGENFQAGAAAFCERQQLALEFIKERRKKESRFDSFLSDHEKHPLCRRLPLQGIIPTEMQRLSKYPLLLERLIHIEEKHRQRDPDAALVELQKLRLAHDRSKEIVNYVNEAAKIACNRARLEDIQRHLDTSIFEKTDHAIVNEFKNVDLTRYSLIHEGTMHLRRPNKQPVALHIVLLEEAVILLQKDAERYVLKFFQAGTPTQQPLAPIIKTSTLLVRANAASKSSLFLVNTSSQNSQMYDLLARDSSERDTWFKHISDAAEAYNRREGKSKRCEPTPDTDDSETLQDLPSVRDVSERADHVGGDVASATDSDSCGPSGESSNRNSDVIDEERDKMLSQSDSEGTNTNEVVGGGVMLKVAADDWPLVQPTEVHISVLPVHKAEPVLTPFEQIRRKDEEVRRALSDKEGLVADLLSIPREDYQLIADIASDEAYKKAAIDREPAEVVLAALFQADQLLAAVNDSLNVSEADAAWVAGGKFSSCASNEGSAKQNNHVPSVPVHRLQGIATTLSTQLTTLLSIIKDRDEERDRLRRELQRTREQLHEKLSLHGPTPENPENDSSQPGDLESIEESPTENDN